MAFLLRDLVVKVVGTGSITVLFCASFPFTTCFWLLPVPEPALFYPAELCFFPIFSPTVAAVLTILYAFFYFEVSLTGNCYAKLPLTTAVFGLLLRSLDD